MINKRILTILSGALLFLGACGGSNDDNDLGPIISIEEYFSINGITDFEKTASGIYYIIHEEGGGQFPTISDVVSVDFQGFLLEGSLFAQGFDETSLVLKVGDSLVISGVEEGVTLVREGGKASLYIPAALAFGDGGNGIVRPNEPIRLEINSLTIKMTIEEYLEENEITDFIETPSGLIYVVDEQGEGEFPEVGQTVTADYEGFLLGGTKFDSSLDLGSPLSFIIGTGQVIAGWDEGMAKFRKGGSGTLYIPSELAYGIDGIGSLIGPYEPLRFEISIVDIQN